MTFPLVSTEGTNEWSRVARSVEVLISSCTALVLACILCFAACYADGTERPREVITLVDRVVTQDQGTWIIDYRLRNASRRGVIVTPDEIKLKVEGWVSNSRVSSHALPRWSSVVITAGVEPTAFADVINAVDESERCRERVTISIWGEGRSPRDLSPPVTNINPPAAVTPPAGSPLASCQIISLGPQQHGPRATADRSPACSLR